MVTGFMNRSSPAACSLSRRLLIAESPTAFRRRLLFVSKDALSRPRI